MHPYMVARVLGGAAIVLAQLIFAYNILMTARSSRVEVQPAITEGSAEELVAA
jgi:cbb3-type cytochrome oxidase subunit 1